MSKIIAICGAIVAGLWGLVAIFMKGKSAGKSEIIAKQNSQVLENIENATKIEQDVNNMSSDELDKWLRKNASDK